MNRVLPALLALASICYGAVRWPTSTGAPLHRIDFANIQFSLNTRTAQTAVSGGDAMAAVQGALDAWNALPFTALHFAPLTSTAAGIANDNLNIISLADTPEAISAVGGAVAVTVPYGFADGRLTESDIILNPNLKYSTTPQSGAYDLRSVITHELGHALGANHATSLFSTMFWTTLPRDTIWSQLKPDDASFAVEAYPGTGAASAYGRITGKATKDGAPLLGAGILATDPSTGISIGGLSSVSDGTYSLTVPPGSYQVYAAPVTPFTPPAVLYGISGVDTAFKAAAATALVQIGGGAAANADVATGSGASAIGIVEIGKVANGASWGPTVLEVQAGQAVEAIVFGPGLDASITEAGLKLIGPGIALRAGTLRVDSTIRDSGGLSPLRFTMDVAARSTQTSASLFIAKGADTVLLAGGIAILPVTPLFNAASLVNAASSTGLGVAPGELASLYGTAVGPDPPVNNAGYDATGTLPGTLGGVAVTFDGIAAPLLYVSSTQVNLQVPYEVSGKGSAVVVVTNQGIASAPVTVPVVAARPGLFTVAVNPDGSINLPGSPAAKGTYVVFYATGAGAVSPPVPTGKPAPNSPLSFAASIAVTIGGLDATVYQGGVLAPGFVGLLQVAAQVPLNAASGSVPAVLSALGQTSPAFSIYVK